MTDFNQQKLELLTSIGRYITAINNEVDWFIAYSQETDPVKRKVYYTIFESKCKKTLEIAKEEYERFK